MFLSCTVYSSSLKKFSSSDLDEKPALFTSEKHGSDENGDGTEGNPFKTVIQAMRCAKVEPFPVIMVDGKGENAVSATQASL